MEKSVAETIFGNLEESSSQAKLCQNEFTFKVDRKFGRFMGAIVRLEDGKLYESSTCGDGMTELMRNSAQKHGFKFVTAMDAGLFK